MLTLPFFSLIMEIYQAGREIGDLRSRFRGYVMPVEALAATHPMPSELGDHHDG